MEYGDLVPFEFYYDKLAKKTRFDESETIFIKRLLQVELQEDLRSLITNSLFEKYVGNHTQNNENI